VIPALGADGGTLWRGLNLLRAYTLEERDSPARDRWMKRPPDISVGLRVDVGAMEVSMRLTRKSIGKVILRVVGLFLLAGFLQWAGMKTWPTREGTLYAQVAHFVGAGAPEDTLAKLPPQQ
jgi:hypothetical protein